MAKERRRFYRIEDIVSMKAEVVNEAEAPERINQFWQEQHQFSIRNDFNYKLEQHQADLKAIKTKMPELGRYLSILQEQLDILTDKILEDEEKFTDLELQVNLGAQGIAFISPETAQPGDVIELHLKLNPGRQKIVIFARVVSCNPVDNPAGHYDIALDFEHIHDADREIIVKHVHGKQLTALGASRFED